MEDNIIVLVQKTMQILRELELAEGTLKSYKTRAFRPIIDYYQSHEITEYQNYLMLRLENLYHDQYEKGALARKTFNWRIRGIRILAEVYITGSYEWKVYSHKKKIKLPAELEYLVNDFISGIDLSKKRKHNIESIVRRFIKFSSDYGISDLAMVSSSLLRDFMIQISIDRPKSMDDVVDALRKFLKYLSEKTTIDSSIWMLLSAPRARDHKVKPSIKTCDVYQIINEIDKSTPKGKRDFALLTLASTTGLRAGDIAKLQMSDINWQKRELHLTQGKTTELLILPLQKNVMNAIANYILHGRPDSNSRYIFLRSNAPYSPFADGVSVASVFRKYLSKSGIKHVVNDGKTLHGLRRMIGTEMLISGTPVTIIAQVLGHTNMKAMKQYISLDLERLRSCSLSIVTLDGDDK